ncbi:MAG: M56 family metallopeptidase [Evtepia sp.]
MDQFCYTLLTMSLTAALAALGVMLLRLFLYKLPKALVCALWLVVLFRMVCPVGLSLPVSLFPEALTSGTTAQYILFSAPGDQVQQEPQQETLPTPETSVAEPPVSAPDPAPEAAPPLWPKVVVTLWATGAAFMLLWGAVSYLRLRRRIADAVRLEGTLFETDRIDTPFVCGFFRPRIYLPVNLDPTDRKYVVLHEQAHIRRLDHLTKPLAYLALCVHWFNPVLHAAFRLFCRDVEGACDQAVIRNFDRTDTAGYAAALLHLGRRTPLPQAVPLASGEEDAKERIQSVLRYQRPLTWVLILAAVGCLAAALCLLSDPRAQGSWLDWNSISQGTVVSQGRQTDLPDDLRQEAVDLLGRTPHSSYSSCEDPGLPEGTVVLSRPDSSLQYRLILEGPQSPRLVKVTEGGCKARTLEMNRSDAELLQDWAAFCYRLDSVLDPAMETAGGIYTLRTGDGSDLAASAALLDALGVRAALGDYSLTWFQDYNGPALVLALETQPSEADRTWTDQFLDVRGKLFLSLTETAVTFSWYYPDNTGSETERKMLPFGEDTAHRATQAEFQYLYAQRRLGWTQGLCLPNCTSFCGTVAQVYHPAYMIAEIPYRNTEIPREYDVLDDWKDPLYSEVVILPHLLYRSLNRYMGSSGTITAGFSPLEDLTLSDPVYHPQDILADETVRAAWAILDKEGQDPTTTEYVLYETETALYLACWHLASGEDLTRYLDYVFRLEEKPVSDDLSSYYDFLAQSRSHA